MELTLVERKQVSKLRLVILIAKAYSIKIPLDIRKMLLKYLALVYEYEITDVNDRRKYRVDGILHRENGPAIIWANGYQEWYKEDKLHRLDGPAVIYATGDQEWYKEDKLHRLDGPAVIYAAGDQYWYKEGRRHRLDGPAIIYADGDQKWYIEGCAM